MGQYREGWSDGRRGLSYYIHTYILYGQERIVTLKRKVVE